MKNKITVSGGDKTNCYLYPFSSPNQGEIPVKALCTHAAQPLALTIKGKEHLALSCEVCKDIKLASPLSLSNEITLNPLKDHTFSKKVKRMCQGEENILYVEYIGTDEIIELDCSKTPFTETGRIKTGTKHLNGLCFVPSPQKMLIISDNQNKIVQAVPLDSTNNSESNDNIKIVWKLKGTVHGKKIYPRGWSTHGDRSSELKKILVADGERSRVLVLDPATGAHLQTIGPSEDTLPDMCVAFDLSFYQEQNQGTKWLVVSHRDYPGYTDSSSKGELPVHLTWLELPILPHEVSIYFLSI